MRRARPPWVPACAGTRGFRQFLNVELVAEQQPPQREHDEPVSQRKREEVDQARIPGSLPPLSRLAVDAPLRLPWHSLP
jgi:hypothetical protein